MAPKATLTGRARGPSWEKSNLTLMAPSLGSTRCSANDTSPGPRADQLKERPSTSSVTTQTAFGSRGCFTSYRLPSAIAVGAPSSARTDSMESVHVGQDSTSTSTAHTRSGAAATSTVSLTCTWSPCQTGHSAGPLRRATPPHAALDSVASPDACG